MGERVPCKLRLSAYPKKGGGKKILYLLSYRKVFWTNYGSQRIPAFFLLHGMKFSKICPQFFSNVFSQGA